MSIEAVSWALNVEGLASPAHRIVLVGIANHDGDGGAWPHLSTLARYACRSERSISRILADLETGGFITRHVGDGGTHRIPADRRPTLYELHRPHGTRYRRDDPDPNPF